MKRLISALICSVGLVSCSNGTEISYSEVSVAEIVTTVTSVQKTQAVTTESTIATAPETTAEAVNETADIEVPENAVYSQKKYRIKDAEKQLTQISFFDKYNNIICNVKCNLNDNIFRTMRYVYKYNDDGTISTKKLIAENGISSNNEYEYNENGTLKSISYFSEGGDLIKTDCYEYNKDGTIRLKSTFKPDESEPCVTEAHEYEYDENDRIARDIITIVDNFLSAGYEGTETLDYTYDENDNILTEHSVRKGSSHILATDDNEDNMTVYAYNAENQCISAEITDKYGVSIIEYEYYEKPDKYIDDVKIPENAVYKQTVFFIMAKSKK